jgi:anti-sigma factor RsiW
VADSADHFVWDERLQDWIDGDLDPSEGAALEAHVTGCTLCRPRLSAFRAADALLSKALPRETLTESFDRSILERVERASKADRAAARARIEQEWQTQMGALSRQWRNALRSTVLNLVLATALSVAFLSRLPLSPVISRLVDQVGELAQHAGARPALAMMVAAAGATVVAALCLVRALGEGR